MEDVGMKRIKLAFKGFVILVVVLLLTTAGVTYWALNYPGQAFSLVQRYFLPEDLTIKWEEMNFQAKRVSWRHWDVDWSMKKLLVEKRDPQFVLPIDQAAMRFTVRVFEDGPWFAFREIKAATTGKMTFKPSPPGPDEESGKNPFEQLQSYLGYLRTATDWLTVDVIDLQVPDFVFSAADGKSESKLAFKVTKPSKEKEPGLTDYEVSYADTESRATLTGWIDANRIDKPIPFFYAEVVADGKNWKTTSQIHGVFQNENAKFTAGSVVAVGEGGKAMTAQPQWTLTMSEAEGLIKIETPIQGMPGPLVKLDKVEVEAHIPFDHGFEWSERPATFKIWTPVDLFFIDKDMRPPLEKSCRCKIPEKLTVTYDGRIWPRQLLSAPTTSSQVMDSKLSVEGVDNKLLSLNLNAHLKVLKQKDQWIFEPRMDSAASVESFQGLRQFLDARNVMIPAPLDILDGKILMTARGSVDHDEKLIRVSVDAKVDLSSPTQKVLLDSSVRFDLARDFKNLDIFVQTLIREVRIEMPPIDPVRGIPSFKTDSRLVFKAPSPLKNSKFRTRVFFDVKTASPGAVKLLSKLAEPYAPVTIEVNNNNKGESAGSIRLEPFDISYLRRKVHVERLQVTLSENEDGDFPIGGRLRLDQTAYKIYVDLGGTLDAPIVNLNSEPFLPRADIISVLLFDRVNDQLVSADADTAGSFDAALADRAIGLLGLYAFATTPIRSFSYNAVTKVYTATVQIADGLTAGLGTNWERATHLEVRKRVSRRWVLTASWSPSEDREQVGKLVLQWEKRF